MILINKYCSETGQPISADLRTYAYHTLHCTAVSVLSRLCTAPLLFEKGEEKFLLLIRQLEVSVRLVLPVVLLVLVYLVH